RTALGRVQISDPAALLVHESIPLGVVHAAALAGPIHTLYHPRLSFEAGRAFFAGQSSALPFTGHGTAAEIGAENSLLVRYLARYGGAVPEAIWQHIGMRARYQNLPSCGALAAAWSRAQPASGSLAKLAAQLGEDRGAHYLARLRRFFGPTALAAPAGARRIPPEVATEMTQLYVENYAHSAPFD